MANPSSSAQVLPCGPATLNADGILAALSDLSTHLSAAASQGSNAVFSEAERILGEFERVTSVNLILNAGGSWRAWRSLDTLNSSAINTQELPADVHLMTAAVAAGNTIYVPIRPGSVIAIVGCAGISGEQMLRAMAVATGCIDLALTASERREASMRTAGELHVLHAVAGRILQTSELEEILLLLTHETKRLLTADICGVMMREGSEVVMRNCVGNLSIETAKLRMESGRGVAGRVLATSQPCVVTNYVDSEAISREFVPLARIEHVRSALAVPILSRDAVIGVLEVWRRRPSIYTSEDTALLLALAGLTSLAIDNAGLHQQQIAAANELAAANAEIKQRFDVIEKSVRFQERVVQLMLRGKRLSAIAEETSEHAGGTILIFDHDLALQAARCGEEDQKVVVERARTLIRTRRRGQDQAIVSAVTDEHILAQPITARAELLGWIVRFAETEPSEATRLTLSYVSLVVAMDILERRNVARVRTEGLQAVLWDLTEGTPEIRVAALDRARELRVTFSAKVCVLVATLNGLDAGWPDMSASETQVMTDGVLKCARMSDFGRTAHLVGSRGTQLRMICKAADVDHLCDLAKRMVSDIQRELPRLAVTVGLSSPCGNLRELPSSFREATIALDVARCRKDGPVAVYSDIGVLGLLINLSTNSDMRRLSSDILGKLIAEPTASRGALLATLKAFFESDCSKVATAKLLGTHQKTIAYRLAKITALTGLDLARHQDRVLADIGIRLYMMLDPA